MRHFGRIAVHIIIVGVIIGTLLCAGLVSAASPTAIKFWGGWTGPDRFGMEKIVTNFIKENPDIRVQFFTAPWTEVFTKFGTTFGTSAGPDLLAMHVADISQFASRGMLLPVEDIAAQNKIQASDFPPSVWQGQFYKGRQYGIPLDYHPMAIYKNVDLFKKAGLDPNITFDSKEEFINALKKLTVKDSSGKIVQYGIAIGSNHPHTMRYWYSLLFQAGGSFLNESGTKAAFNSEAGVKALQFLHDLIYTYKVAPTHESDIDKDFLTGRVATLIEGPWWVPGIKEQKGLQATVAPFPKIFEKPAVWAGSHTLTLPKQANKKKLDAAIKLLNYIIAHSVDWGAAGQIPASKSVIASEAYKNLVDYKYYKTFIDQADTIRYEPLMVQNASFGSDNQMSPVLNAIFAVILNEKTPKEALDEAAEEVNAILE
ncbi:MAG: ABC transporter substrate-binding protein [Firmicutes bacterium]|nr:ABC transporter substrate-binding protein [Bacillota bacterium]